MLALCFVVERFHRCRALYSPDSKALELFGGLPANPAAPAEIEVGAMGGSIVSVRLSNSRAVAVTVNRGTHNALYLIPPAGTPVPISQISDAGPVDFSSDGQSLFVLDNANGMIVNLSISNQTTIGTIPLTVSPQSGNAFTALVASHDGAHLFMTQENVRDVCAPVHRNRYYGVLHSRRLQPGGPPVSVRVLFICSKLPPPELRSGCWMERRGLLRAGGAELIARAVLLSTFAAVALSPLASAQTNLFQLAVQDQNQNLTAIANGATVTLNANSDTQSVTVNLIATYRGVATATVMSPQLTGSPAFSVVSSGSETLNPGDSLTIGIVFTPTAAIASSGPAATAQLIIPCAVRRRPRHFRPGLVGYHAQLHPGL